MNTLVWHQHALINKLQTFVLLLVMAAFMALLGWLLWGGFGVALLLGSATLLSLINPGITPQLVMRLYRARRLGADEVPQLYSVLSKLAQRSELSSVPALYYIPSDIVNAFAVGEEDNAGIAVTAGMLSVLNLRELSAVLAHEISHIRSNDMRVMHLADFISRATSFLSLFGQLLLFINLPLILYAEYRIHWAVIALLIFAPTLSTLAQLGLSRTREYDADLNAARLTGDPEGLAQAFIKIEKVQGGWLERLFLPGRRLPDPSILRTHPPTEERIRRLRELALPEQSALPIFHNDDNIRHNISRGGHRKPRWRVSGLWH